MRKPAIKLRPRHETIELTSSFALAQEAVRRATQAGLKLGDLIWSQFSINAGIVDHAGKSRRRIVYIKALCTSSTLDAFSIRAEVELCGNKIHWSDAFVKIWIEKIRANGNEQYRICRSIIDLANGHCINDPISACSISWDLPRQLRF